MGMLKEYATGIIVVSVFAMLCEMLMPEGNLKRYSKVVVGLIVMLVIVGPITKLPFYAETFVMPALDTSGQLSQEELAMREAEAIERQFEADLAARMEQDVLETCGETVAVQVTVQLGEDGMVNGIARVDVTCGNPMRFGDIVSRIHTQFGVEKDRIMVTSEEGAEDGR